MHTALAMPSDTASTSVAWCILLARDAIILPSLIAETREQ